MNYNIKNLDLCMRHINSHMCVSVFVCLRRKSVHILIVRLTRKQIPIKRFITRNKKSYGSEIHKILWI